MSENLKAQELRMALLNSFILRLEDLLMISANTKLQYLRMLFNGKTLLQFYTLCDQLVTTTIAHLKWVILVLGV